MNKSVSIRTLAGVAAMTAFAVTSCGSDDPPLPQLSAATGSTFTGNGADLATPLGTFANTTITASTTVAGIGNLKAFFAASSGV